MDRNSQYDPPRLRGTEVRQGFFSVSQCLGVSFSVIVATTLMISLPGPVYAQHDTAADLLDGGRAYAERCATCHGPNGDLVPNIDFSRGQFRRPIDRKS